MDVISLNFSELAPENQSLNLFPKSNEKYTTENVTELLFSGSKEAQYFSQELIVYSILFYMWKVIGVHNIIMHSLKKIFTAEPSFHAKHSVISRISGTVTNCDLSTYIMLW